MQPYKKAFNGDHDAGTNKLEDVDIYAFDPPAPADEGTINNVVVNSTDEVLKSLLRADIAHDRWIAGWENHKENLPEDPSQARLAASLVSHACLCNVVQLACHGVKVSLSRHKHIMLELNNQAVVQAVVQAVRLT